MATLISTCKIPSKDCDIAVQEYCRANPTDLDFCGCSANALVNVTDPQMGNSPVKCWAKSCTQNANAYQFFSYQTDPCPNICIDKSTITSIGSNITDSSFNQASCGATQQISQDTNKNTTITQIYQYGIAFAVLVFVLILLISISMSSIVTMIPSE